MSTAREVMSQYKWFILGGCSLVVFFILLGAISAILLTQPQSLPELIELSPIPESPTNTPENILVITPTINVISTSTQPTGIEKKLPAKEIAYVERVVDGDSIEVMLDGELVSLRYIGLDAPEIGMPYSLESAEINTNMVEGQIVELERDVSDTDKYGRLLRYVYLQDGTMVNAELVRSGYALALTYPPDIRYQELFNSLEKEAKENGMGLWAPPTPTAAISDQDLAPQLQVEPSCSQFNAPGNDNENKNEEYVCIANVGSSVVDLSGWSVQDQYGWTYLIPIFSLNAGSKVNIRSGCGTDTQHDLFWCKDETAVWNNDGDCVFLMNPDGQLMLEYCY